MKKIVKFVLVILLLATIGACTKEQKSGNEYLEVTPNSLSGVWRLVSYDNGTSLGEGSYFYVEFYRSNHTFVSYDNLSTMEANVRTGEYQITVDEAAIIRGMYDYEQGDWEHRYYVRDLTATTMRWVATDDETNVRLYVRDELPAELKALTPDME